MNRAEIAKWKKARQLMSAHEAVEDAIDATKDNKPWAATSSASAIDAEGLNGPSQEGAGETAAAP